MSDQARPGSFLRRPPRPDPEQRAEALKERVYVAFAALAVTVALERDAGYATAGRAALTLLLTVVGTVLAMFVASLIAHMIQHGTLPSAAEMLHLLRVNFGSVGVLAVPLAILGLSALDIVAVGSALRWIAAALIATLLVVTFLAVRRLSVDPWAKALVLAVMASLGVAVLGVELAAH